MNRSQLIHVITLVGTTTCIQERIHTGNQQATFMHRNRERTGKDGTSLSILEGTITKQKRIMSREIVCHMRSLPDKTTYQFSRIRHDCSRRDDKIFSDHTITNKNRSQLITIDCPISQTGCIFNHSIFTDLYVANSSCIYNSHMITYNTILRSMLLGIIRYQCLQTFNQQRTMTI